MHPRTTSSGRRRAAHARRRPPARRSGLYLGMAAAGAVLVNVVVGAEPAASADAAAVEPVSVAEQLGLTARATPAAAPADLQPLEELAASRSSREAAETAAQQVQAAADQAELVRRQAEADAAAQAAAEVARAAAAAEAAAAERATATATATAAAAATAVPSARQRTEEPAATAGAVLTGAVARITNSTGSVEPQAQAAADAVVSAVPGAAAITIGGTRASAADPGGHPSGLALDYMVGTDDALGDAIAQYQIDNWDSLGVEYVIWQQRMLSSPNGSWKPMADRGGTTANHYDHVHVNYLG